MDVVVLIQRDRAITIDSEPPCRLRQDKLFEDAKDVVSNAGSRWCKRRAINADLHDMGLRKSCNPCERPTSARSLSSLRRVLRTFLVLRLGMGAVSRPTPGLRAGFFGETSDC